MTTYNLGYHFDEEHGPDVIETFKHLPDAIDAYKSAIQDGDFICDEDHWFELYNADTGETIMENSC